MPTLFAQLKYDSFEEAADFQQEVDQLEVARFAPNNRSAHLLVIYRRLVAELSPFAQQMRRATPPAQRPLLLAPWLAQWTCWENHNERLFEVLLSLDARGLDALSLQRLHQLPTALRTVTNVGLLRLAPLAAIQQWTDLYEAYSADLTPQQLALAYRLVLETFFHEAGQLGTHFELVSFLQDCYGPLVDKFPAMVPEQEALRVAAWFQLYITHQRKEVPNLSPQHAYYQLAFPTIIKYLPACVLWNSGLPYVKGEKAFQYDSEAFIWLATGGSLRKLPNHPPYSKRMAKEFLALPPALAIGEADVYTYCFLRSLETPHEMALALQRFFRRPTEPADVPGWMSRLNPIVQKLQEARYDWASGQGDFLLNYLSRAVRDKFGFAVNVRPIEQLEQEAQAYYDRIAARAAAAERRKAALQANREQRCHDTWTPLRGVAPWQEEGRQYELVRRWKITELTNRTQLEAEGQQLRHCVSTYVERCRNGHASIWSLRELRQNGLWYSLVTIEVIPKQRRIVQLSALRNARPQEALLERIREWADREGLASMLG